MENRIQITNEDNMALMARYPDNYFDLAIVDPPYGIGEDGGKVRVKKNRPNSYLSKPKHEKKNWDKYCPDDDYFREMFRVSKNQIVFGANFFISMMPYDSSCWVVWDKNIGGDQADCELAWTSFKTAVRKFFGHPFIGTNGGKDRIHPTQKPVKLYEWLLMNYAKEGDKILDTHLGSGSIAIACDNLGFDLTACERDKDYYDAAMKRLVQHQAQTTLF